ncbi:hypothetical protein FHS21_004597 [Phyllobacterium trifolii]|uniref:Uncharacterized protein n=1 Tax=Phyllobacterium trifolii TaxID=300193 RepID=A0A839UE61_9HYPH|nr:hypothetical protein [Phyllobacterium trifolii]MBB3148154.1 hypothetical protein [Phyllobacterium trifolii]
MATTRRLGFLIIAYVRLLPLHVLFTAPAWLAMKSASGENKYSEIRRFLTYTVTDIPRNSSIFLPSISMVVVSGLIVTGNTRFCMR